MLNSASPASPHPISNSTPNPTTSNTGYFVDQKKGEVNELKQALKNLNVEKEPKRKREVIKKVIAYMTLGIDVSRLMTDMIMAIETKDMVVKKMVYFYLCSYAHTEPELAIMCINTLRRDCDNEDPMVRGLALRSLCGLRLESVLEYVQQPLQKSLSDISPYVRKTGVMGILKIYSFSSTSIESNGYISQIYRMIQDTDANVVTNVIYVLNEILISKGGIEINQTMILSLLNRISEFSEWGLNNILDLVARYTPASEDEMFSIMNLLDPVLRTANSAAVIGTFKCFMTFTVAYPDLQPQIYSRSKPPILTLITGGNPEVQYAILKHLQLMLQRKAAKHIFDDEYRQFYVRYNEPPYVKHLKVDVLPLLANESNAKDIATELNEYVTDVDSELSKRAIVAIAEIGMRVASVTAEMTTQLVVLIDLDMSYVRNEAMRNIVNILRIYPHGRSYIIPSLSRCLKRVDDSEAKASLIWMLGEYGKEILEAPYLLEPMIDNYMDENSILIKLTLLSAAMKLFFKRPPEMQAMLGRLLQHAMNDTSHQDVHDRALLYFRLLTTNTDAASSLFSGFEESLSPSGIKVFAELLDTEKLNQIFNEFNTLAIIYQMPSQKFIERNFQSAFPVTVIQDYDPSIPATDKSSLPSTPTHHSNNSNNSNGISTISSTSTSSATTTNGQHLSPPTTTSSNLASISPASSMGINLLDLDDNNNVSIPKPSVSPTPSLSLKSTVDLSPQQYQSLWLSLQESFHGRLCSLATIPRNTVEVEIFLRSSNITTMASGPLQGNGGQPQGFKFFLTAAESDSFPTSEPGPLYLLQLSITEGSGEVSVTLKTTNTKPDAGMRFIEYLIAVFRPLGLLP